MNTETVTIQVAPQTAALLQALQTKAEAQGVSLEALLRPLADEDRAGSPEQAQNLVQWLRDHSVYGVVADDSRERIYTREDEAL